MKNDNVDDARKKKSRHPDHEYDSTIIVTEKAEASSIKGKMPRSLREERGYKRNVHPFVGKFMISRPSLNQAFERFITRDGSPLSGVIQPPSYFLLTPSSRTKSDVLSPYDNYTN